MPFGVTTDMLEKALLGLSSRFEATSNNIANANTPKYARREVSFEDQLKEVVDGPSKLPLRVSDPAHISNVTTEMNKVSPVERPVSYELYRSDSNNIDPETETVRMAETRMMYAAIAQRMGGKLSGLRRAISGR